MEHHHDGETNDLPVASAPPTHVRIYAAKVLRADATNVPKGDIHP